MCRVGPPCVCCPNLILWFQVCLDYIHCRSLAGGGVFHLLGGGGVLAHPQGCKEPS